MTDRYPAPKASASFRPRVDVDVLSHFVRKAWEAEIERHFGEEARIAAAVRIAALIELRHPPADMDVLERYACTEMTERAEVSIYDPGTTRWDVRVTLELPHPIRVARNHRASDFMTGPYWSRDPYLGCRKDYFETLSPDKRDELRASALDRESMFVPEDMVSFFEGYRDLKKRYDAEYRITLKFPDRFKEDHGRMPTWAEIEAQHPVLGAYIASVRA